jgi:hypothetical protein
MTSKELAMRQLFKRSLLGGTVVSALVLLSSILLVLGVALKVSGQDSAQEQDQNPFNIPTRDNPEPNNGFGGGAYVQEPVLPSNLNVFNLSLEQTRQYSKKYRYEVVGHSYFHGYEKYMTAAAIAAGQGAGFNTPRVYDGIGYFGGAGFYAIIIADVEHGASQRHPVRPGNALSVYTGRPDSSYFGRSHGRDNGWGEQSNSTGGRLHFGGYGRRSSLFSSGLGSGVLRRIKSSSPGENGISSDR